MFYIELHAITFSKEIKAIKEKKKETVSVCIWIYILHTQVSLNSVLTESRAFGYRQFLANAIIRSKLFVCWPYRHWWQSILYSNLDLYSFYRRYWGLVIQRNSLSVDDNIHIYQPLCSGRIWHKINF